MIAAFLRDKRALALLILLILVLVKVHFNWIFSAAPLVSGDWPYFYPEQLKSWFPFHELWINYDGLGRTISQGNFIFLFSVFSWLAQLGANFEFISRLLFFLPVLILAPLTSYIAVKEITSNRVAALTGACIYSINSYFMVIQGGHMHLSMAYALAPLAYYFAIVRKDSSYFWLFVVLAIMGLYDIRMTLIIGLFAAIIAYFYKVKDRWDLGPYVKHMAMGAVGFVLFNSFWIVPMLFTAPDPFSKNVFNQDALNWVSQLDAFTLHHPFWSEVNGVTDFVFQTPSFFLAVLPIFAFLPFVLLHSTRKRELLLYGGGVLVSMIFLMQENSLFAVPYRVLYEHLPMMSMFRESSKMFFVLAFCYSALVGILVAELLKKRQRYVMTFIMAGLIFTVLLPIGPYLTGRFVKTYRQEPASAEITAINQLVAPDRQWGYRNLWISNTPKFAKTLPETPNVNALALARFWGGYSDQFDALGYLREDNIRGLLNFAGIKHVIVPSESIDANYHHYGYQSSDYYRDIVKEWGLEQTKTIGENTVWKNEDYKPLLYFSTDTIAADSVGVFSGIDESRTATLVFRDQNLNSTQRQTLDSATDNVEIPALTPPLIRVGPGHITSSLDVPPNKQFDLYSKTPEGNMELTKNFDATQDIMQTSSLITGKNLYPNGSFEKPEKLRIIDAHNYDRTTLQQNGIAGKIVSDATDGKNGLELTARRHIADLSQTITDFDTNAYYLIALDYKYIAGPAPRIALYPYDQEPYTHQTPLSTDKPNQWSSHYMIAKPGHFSDIEKAHLLVYLPTEEGQNHASKTIIDNIRVFKLPAAPGAYLRTKNAALPALAYKTLETSATRRRITVTDLHKPRLLVFSETYSPNWILKVKNGQTVTTIPTAQHIVANGFANSWWIDPHALPVPAQNTEGTYELILEYTPQNWFGEGLTLTGLTVLTAAAHQVRNNWLTRRRNNKSAWRTTR